ncbi:MAG: hypothetical protein Q7J25_00675 [Vicinamibacterales bacterium]|nr:hypothetical protein [Vicinamibacterales bacterium]
MTTADVQQLITRGQPADHARLSAHFTAMADRYAAEAKRHASMQPAFAGNSKLAHLAVSQAAHCKQLAARNQESAGVLRELAAHHSKEAAGAASTAPAGSERFQGAVQVPSDTELTKLAASAGTAADHSRLAGYFSTLAAQYERDARDSTTYASSWRKETRNSSSTALAARWERLAKQQSESATEARAAAAMHTGHAATAK